jgi:putative Holliday junction resolvase
MEQTEYILALDVGGRRIGVALASTSARLPAPLCVLDQESSQDIYGDIEKLVKEHQARVLVVGLPRGMSGQETAQTAATRAFAAELTKRLSIPVVMQDEAGTSKLAESNLQARGKAYNKGDIDAEAAAIILQDYLNQQLEHTA